MINKQITLSYFGGFPFDQQTLKFIQDSYNGIVSALIGFTGDNVIVSGVVRSGGYTSSGWIIYNGELLPFIESKSQTNNFAIRTLKESVKFEDTQSKEVYITKYAENCGDTEGASFGRLTRLDSYKQFCENLEAYKTIQTIVNDSIDKRLEDLKERYDKNLITCYFDVDLDAGYTSVSTPVYSPKNDAYDLSGNTFGRWGGAMGNYIVVCCKNDDYPSLNWTVYMGKGYTDGRTDQVQVYVNRGAHTGRIQTRLWYILIHKNYTTPLLGNSYKTNAEMGQT